ncbi:MAG: hypothetical protein IPP40_16905 [bacterium]|nr:hypothetical protein [bacterium]
MSPNFSIDREAFDTIGPGIGQNSDGFISKLNWRTGEYAGSFIGTSNSNLILVDGNWVGADYVILAGVTTSPTFPTTIGAFDRVLNNGSGSENDAFVL